jgi:two-component system response regulator HydG
MKLGAFDFMEKPVNHLILKEKVEAAMGGVKGRKGDGANVGATLAVVQKHNLLTNMVVGNSSVAKIMYEHIQLVAPTDLSVLICGESGTGKEFVARTIHEQSKRNKAPFIAVDCGVLSKELAASELFGHMKGSFTSAISDKTGVFEEANGGTVFFDEVGNLPYEVQAQLLRTLQERKVRKVGSNKEIGVDIRFVSATNEDLEKAIQEGRFREDLYHRLQEFVIDVPALRHRIDDIDLFCNHFREQANQEIAKEVAFISQEALAVLKQHHWKGNLRELKNAIRRAVLFTTGDTIFSEHLPVFSKETPDENFALFDEKDEKQRILNALKRCGGNKSIAAKLLNIDRKTLYNKMHAYGIELQ